MKWVDLPIELIYYILTKYDGRFSVRNGRLMTKLAENDGRRQLLDTISPKMYCNIGGDALTYVSLPIHSHKQCFISYYGNEHRVCFPRIWVDTEEE